MEVALFLSCKLCEVGGGCYLVLKFETERRRIIHLIG